MTELGELPSGWTPAPLRDVATINPPNPACVPADDKVVSFVPMVAVEELSGRMNASTARPWSDVKRGFTRFQDGDVVFAKITPSMENGKVALAANLVNGVAAGTTEFHVFRPLAGVAGRYLLHYLLQATFRRRARARMTGTAGQLRVPTQFLEEEVLPLAPTAEQQRIVDAIDSYLTRLDAAVASLERVKAKLRAYRASVLKAAVEGLLVPTEASLARSEKRDYEPAEALLARILKERHRRWEEAELVKLSAAGKPVKDHKWKAKYAEPVAPDTSSLPELPEGWCWASPEQLASTDAYSLGIGPFGSSLKVSDYTAAGTPLVFVRNIRAERFADNKQAHYISATKATELRAHVVAPGDILVTKMGDPPGDCCRYPLSRPAGVITADCIKLRLHTYLPCVDFFVYAIRSGLVQTQIYGMTKGVAQKKVSLARFRRLALPLPPAVEQQRIADKLEGLVSVARHTEHGLEAELQRCSRLRQAILKWAFEGKLVDQDPGDEPAEKLLARIRAERAAVSPASKARGLWARGAA